MKLCRAASPLLALLALAACASLAQASIESGFDSPEGLNLKNGQSVRELRSRASRLGSASGAVDTMFVGYTPGHQGPGNWWSIYSGTGKDGYNRPINGVPHKGVWNFESAVSGDSLQGWWPLINVYNTTGGQTRTDRNRPWWAIEFGNMANYRSNQANGRTFGVVGVWHRDGGLLQPAPAPRLSPAWTPAQGSYAAWMGLRASGDAANLDPITLNAFNEDVMMYTSFGAISSGGNDAGFPGYGSQMDQMLYRDVDLSAAPPGSSLTIRFKFRTVMSTGFGTTASTRTGWFDSDPLGVMGGFGTNPQPNNFISSNDAGDALAPRDSFMVYVGKGIEGDQWMPAASSFGQGLPAQDVYDPQRRWFGEVLRWDRDPGSNPANPQPLHYKELLSVSGVWPARADTANPGYVDTTFVIPAGALPSLTDSSTLRLVFRVKSNRGFDDQGSAYSSNARGAAVVDAVTYRIGAGPEITLGDFENAGDIDNHPGVSAVSAWKSTGKPPAIFDHTHLFADLLYEDLCGQKGDLGRQCNMSGVVISSGDHDLGEAAGGLIDGTASRERVNGTMSPAICLADDDGNPNTKNVIGLYGPGGNSGVGDVDPDEDYYIFYDIYTGIFDPFTQGNTWRYAAMSYPGNAKASHGSYPAWGQMRFPPITIFNPDKQCLMDIEPLKQLGVIRTSNANGIPDSLRIFLGKTQQCFRFGVSAGCSPTDGCYWDNISLAIIDGGAAPLSVQIWDWVNDAFPANETAGLPGTASFDTAAAHVKTGLNIAQSPNNNLRFDVPGDSTTISSDQLTARVDLVFRILPGPGNYEPVGRPDLGTIVRRPDSRAIVTKGDGSFWDQYRQVPGDFATTNAVVLHHNAIGGWDANVWNSARCDTAEFNLFARQAPGSANVVGGPLDPFAWMATYHESDPHFVTLGIVKNRCFVTGPIDPTTSVVCNGTVPAYISSRPEHADVTATTREFTKILPDGQLTPGAHVEYFFRGQNSKTPGAMSGMCPDTNVVLQPSEGSTDGHRWQQFGVMPNAWKKTQYKHPVTGLFGTGPACLLVIDNNDRRGNERVWVGISDTIGAVPARWWGAHNGWHAVGGGDINDPADNRVAKTGSPVPGFVAEHLGQPGSGASWDMYQVKASESLTTAAGSIGSRIANHTGTPGQQLVIAKSSRQGPTPEMLNTYYTMILFLSGDLNSGLLGPYRNRSQNDAGMLMQWLDAGSSAAVNRGFWAIGDGFVESNFFGEKAITTDLLLDYLGADLVNSSYILHTGNTDDLATYRLLPGWQNKGPSQTQLFGIRNLCLWTNDVVTPGGVGLPSLATVSGEYDRGPTPGSFTAPAGVFKEWDSATPWLAQVEGWDIEHLTHAADATTLDRAGYFNKVLRNVWAQLCIVPNMNPCGTPMLPDGFTLECTDVPGMSPKQLIDFLNMRNNPLRSGFATVHLGLARTDRVEVKIYDLSGRLIRTLADRRFKAGEHELFWDGANDAGRQVARGVYFTRVRYREGGFVANSKVTVLK